MRRKKQREESEINESWLLPYADMLTLLLALFIILFALSELDTQKFKELSRVFENEFSGGQGIIQDGQSPSPQEGPIAPNKDEKEQGDKKEKEKEVKEEPNQLEKIQRQVEAYIAENSLTGVLDTTLTGEGLLISIKTDVTFDSGSAQVKAEGKSIAKQVAKMLHTDPPLKIVVSGHADDRPMHNATFESNWELSAMRAIRFMDLILDAGTLDPSTFSAKGYGEYQPIVPNTNEENRAKNRRVEVWMEPMQRTFQE
ncbi:flagellar motor protein MotB [Virgibacillus sp. W0181]|uniref:flagellar motor protein MotB n=1 Tax=Virgibacillus sp. W0181 TaxID=3391581 RepID=UPI003F47C7F5